MKSLYTKALVSLVALAISMGLLLFAPAGTAQYWQAWVYLGIFTGASLLTTLYLMKKDPALLKRRMSGGPTAERESAQKVIMFFASIGFIGLLFVPALDHRFGWSIVPFPVVIAGDTLVAVGSYFIFLVCRENTFASATIESQKIRRSSLLGHTRWYDTRCTQAHSYISLAHRLRSARTGGSSHCYL